jgi:lipopolysaccharide transport system permease protein
MNDIPLKTIEAKTGFNIIHELRDIWANRELLYLLAWRDYKVRYRQTTIGIAWAILQPVMAMLAFVFIFGRFKEITDNGIPYAIFVYSGLVIWQFFSNSISEASTSLVMSSQMITKIYFPRILIPLAKVITTMIDLSISFLVMVIIMVYYKIFPSLFSLLEIIPIIVLLILISSSFGILLSAINVKYRDVQYALPYFIQLGLFFSPIIYSSTSLGNFRNLLFINPITGIIEAFRSAIFSLPYQTTPLIFSCAITLLLFIFSMYYFIKTEGIFSDVI